MPNEVKQLTYRDLMKLKQKFLTIISRYQITSMSKEDILYEFYYKMLRPSDSDGLNYLERWNGSTTIATWTYRPLKNLCYSIKQKENSKGGMPLTHAASIEESSDREEEFDGSTLFLENYNFGQCDLTSNLMVSQLINIAKERFSGFHSSSSKGYPRSPYFVLVATYNGLSKAQIAKILEVSTTFVDSLLKKFLRDDEVQRIKAEYTDNI